MATRHDPDPSKSSVIVPVLQQHPYFANVPQTSLQRLIERARRHAFGAGQILFLAGERSAGLWILESGRVKVYKVSPEGREHVLHLLGPGEIFNDVPAFDGDPNAASAMSITGGVAWVLASSTLEAALETDHALSLGVVRGLSVRIRQLVVQIEDLALRSVTARLARFLLLQRQNPTSLAGPPVTRALIATHLSTTPETVSRALRTLEETGALAFDRHRIIIRDEDLLRELALL